MKRLYPYLAWAFVLVVSLPPFAWAKDYDLWNDETYDFHAVRRIYVEELDTSQAELPNEIKAYRLRQYFYEKARDLKDWAVVTPPLSPPADSLVPSGTEALAEPSSAEAHGVTSAVPSDSISPVSPSDTAELPPAADTVLPEEQKTGPAAPKDVPPPLASIPEAASQSGADLYVTARLQTYRVGTGVIPAHVRWNYYTVRDAYYDSRGRRHWFSRRVAYPVYVPPTYVPVASVSVLFRVYDVKTGKAVSVSEDRRSRGSSSDMYGVYKRIVDRFFKNLKKELKE